MDREWTKIELNEPFDLYKRKAWFQDTIHTLPRWPVLPLGHVFAMAERGSTWACQRISQPHCKGWMFRTREGSAFLSPIMVTDPKERKQREGPFRENLKPFIEDFHGLWGKYKNKWEDIWEKMYAFDLQKASDIELEDFYRELVRYEEEAFKDHHYLMEGIGTLTLLFEDLAWELCGVNSSMPIWSKLTSGFSSKAFESDKKMHELAQRAIKLGLKDIFQNTDDQELFDKIKNAPKGEELLKDLTEFLEGGYGDRVMQLLNYSTPTWRERPDIILSRIKIFVLGGDEFRHEQVMGRAVKDREAAETELLAKVPSDQRDWFTTLMKCAQNWGWWSEEHEFWLLDATFSLMRRVMLEFGKRWVNYGAFDHQEDIFHIRERDFERVIHAPWDFNLRPEVAKHKSEFEQFKKIQSQSVICYDTIPNAVAWLASMKEFHVSLALGYMPKPQEGINADL